MVGGVGEMWGERKVSYGNIVNTHICDFHSKTENSL